MGRAEGERPLMMAPSSFQGPLEVLLTLADVDPVVP